MKRFIIPAFFIVHAENKEQADTIGELIQGQINNSHWRKDGPLVGLLLDEMLDTRELAPEEEPHSSVLSKWLEQA